MLVAELRQVMIGTAPNTSKSDAVCTLTMHFVVRVLKSWPRMMAAHHTTHLLPIIRQL